jgi:hypothetical protein
MSSITGFLKFLFPDEVNLFGAFRFSKTYLLTMSSHVALLLQLLLQLLLVLLDLQMYNQVTKLSLNRACYSIAHDSNYSSISSVSGAWWLGN